MKKKPNLVLELKLGTSRFNRAVLAVQAQFWWMEFERAMKRLRELGEATDEDIKRCADDWKRIARGEQE